MAPKPTLRLLPALLAFSALAQAEPVGFGLKTGDRVVFYGDSITDYGAYPALIDAFVATRYPELDVSFMNAGVGGERVAGGGLGPVDVRLTRDLFSRRPTVVTVMLGMNDAEYRAFAPEPLEAYGRGYAHILDRIGREAAGARVWLLRPTPYDDVTKPATFPGGYNAVLLRYADAVSELARGRGYGTIDLNAPLVDLLTRAKAANPDLAANLVPDRIHPIPQAHLAVAKAILQAWNASPIVSSTHIDWTTGATRTENATLRGWKGGGFTLREGALPMPLDRKDAFAALVAKAIDFDGTLNRETLQIEGMPTGRYALRIDGETVGTFANADYAQGIDLAPLDTPMARQAKRVGDLTRRIVGLRYTRWRSIEVPLADAPAKERDAVVRGMVRLEAALVAQRRKLAKPLAHDFRIVREEQPHLGSSVSSLPEGAPCAEGGM